MTSQAKPTRHDLWRSNGSIVLAIDAAPGPPSAGPLLAWLDGATVFVQRGGDLLALRGLEAADVESILDGRATVAEFDLEGPRREAAVSAKAPCKTDPPSPFLAE